MLSPDTIRAIEILASELKQRFEPPEYIPGCEVKDIDDKDQYAPNNGWIEAVVSRHNRQRCRWKGQFANIQTGCFVDVLFYPSYRVYTVAGQSGSGGLSIPSDATGTYYDNTSSSISASTVQQAIDVLATSLGFETKYNVKGDLIVASSDNNASRLPVGTDNYVLTADSACDLGMGWKINTGASGVNFEEKYNAKGDLIIASSDNNASRLAVGTDNYVLTANSGCDLGMGWAAASGGGSFSQSYLGYNTVGGSSVAMVQYRTYMKQITVSTAGLLTDIAIHVRHSAATNLQNLMAYVLSDNAGTPHLQISLGARTGSVSDGTFFMTTTARWLSIPIGLYLPAGDYWLCVQRMDDPGTDLMLYYDGSGADKYQDIAGGWSADGSQYTITDTTNAYSIRASLIY